jgi:predicted aconitase
MKFLTKYGDAAGAERLIDIDGTVDLHPGKMSSWYPETAVTLEEIVELASRGEHFAVPTFANKPESPAFIIDGWEDCGCWPQNDTQFHAQCMERLKPLIQMGLVPTLSCDYYLISSYIPTVGQHCAWGESSAIPWANAILGARTNYDGCFEAAYLGKIPEYDMHLAKNRVATRLVECKVSLKSDMHFDLFGWAVGEAVGLEVPVMTGIGKPTTTQLVKMNAELNTGGQVRMYHIPGLTPEAKTASGGQKYVEKISIEEKDLKSVYDKINYASNENVDFVYLGCPHYNIEEVHKVAVSLKGKKCKANLWVMTNPWTFKVAEMMGDREIIHKAGGALLSGSCPGMLKGSMPTADVMATDSAKQNYYITGFVHPRKLQVWYGTTEECLEAAVSGKWKAKWRR